VPPLFLAPVQISLLNSHRFTSLFVVFTVIALAILSIHLSDIVILL